MLIKLMGTTFSSENEEYYWIGVFGVRVHMSIQCVISEDGYNLLFKDGTITTRPKQIMPINMTESIYKSKYAKLRNDGFYYYKGINKNYEDFWKGPYNTKCHIFIPFVVAADGYNTHYKDSSKTDLCIENAPLMNESIYKSEYCKLMDDNNYYHK